MKLKVIALALLLIVCVGAGFGAVIAYHAASTPLPTLAALPTTTDTPLPSDTPWPTATNTATSTPTSTPSYTATPTLTPTPTNTLATLVLRVTVVNPDVTLVPVALVRDTATPTSLPTVDIPTPPVQVPPVPTGDAPQVGWFEYDVTEPAITYQGKWDTFTATYRSANKRYEYSDDANARLTLKFLGAGVRVRYVAYFAYGVFQVVVDGQVLATIDSYYPQQADKRGNFLSTDMFGLSQGWHTLEVVRMGRKAPESQGEMIALDAIDVFEDGPEPTVGPSAIPPTPTLTPSPAPAQKVDVMAAPPTVQPTPTIASPGVVTVNFTIAYDLNGNKAIDPGEGVQGISIRLIASDTNQIVASGYTNGDGYASLQATTNSPLRLVVAYFNKFWDIPAGSSTFHVTMILPPANVPGIIP